MKKITVIKKPSNGHSEELVIELGLREGNNSYFSITASLYSGKSRGDKCFLSGGCIHDEILKERPDLKPIVDLHLSDENGIPMHCLENGFYFFKNSRAKEYIGVLQKHLRMNDGEYKAFTDALDKGMQRGEMFAKKFFQEYVVKECYPRFKIEALNVIKLIETL